jgi:hypothetical protein
MEDYDEMDPQLSRGSVGNFDLVAGWASGGRAELQTHPAHQSAGRRIRLRDIRCGSGQGVYAARQFYDGY